MKRMRTALAACAALSAMLAIAAPASAKTSFKRVFTLGVGSYANDALARTPDGKLHVIFQTTTGSSPVSTGLATRVVSASGALSGPVQALSGWAAGIPGLTVMPGGGLLAAFGAISPNNVPALWTIGSSDGGQTWSTPAQAYSPVTQAYGANLNAQTLNGVPALTLAVSGGITTQLGITANAPASLLTDSSDDSAADVNSAIDGASGAVVVSWSSLANAGGDYIRQAASSLGAPAKVPGLQRNEVQISGRSGGAAGVYAPYTLNGTGVRLFRYGGGGVAVGSLKGVNASVLGIAPAPRGRLWVMWGDDNGVAVTRSNMAVTRFERIQQLKPGSATLFRVYGDGQLGPLDMFADQLPASNVHAPGGYYARVLPLLTVTRSVKALYNKKGAIVGHTARIRVTDAGDDVKGAKVKLDGKSATTGKQGTVQFGFGPGGGSVSLEVTAATYQAYASQFKL
ncbi:MAG: hypothetical protein KGL16_10680 [Acidobacteriota bacterium]|nr:hypothetical protein [Acidobacteriota bacterium]